jgi:Flp pilus assembly protein TadB
MTPEGRDNRQPVVPRRRVARFSVRLPFVRYSLSREPTHDGMLQRSRLSLHSPFGTWELEGEDLLQAAGRKAERERDVQSRGARDTISAAIVGLVGSAFASIVASAADSGALGGGGLAVVGAVIAVSLVALAVAARTLQLTAQRRRRDTPTRALPPNVDRLARELTAGRRAALELRRDTTSETSHG